MFDSRFGALPILDLNYLEAPSACHLCGNNETLTDSEATNASGAETLAFSSSDGGLLIFGYHG